MTKKDKHFDDLFRDKLAAFEEVPPPHVWEGIQQAQQAGKRKALFLYLKLSGIAAAVLVAFLLGRQIAIQPSLDIENTPLVEAPLQADPQMEDAKSIFPATKNEAIIHQEDFLGDSNSVVLASNKETTKKTVSAKRKVKPVTLETQTEIERDSYSLLQSILNDVDNFKKETNTLELASIRKQAKSNFLTADDMDVIQRNKELLAMSSKKRVDDAWQLGAMVSPNVAVNNTSYDMEYANNMSRPGSNEKLTVGGGLSVSYKAGKRWSVQSGVYYSQLGQNSSSQTFDQRQSFLPADNAEFLNATSVAVKSGELLLNASAGVVEIENLPSNARLGSSLDAKSAENGVFLTEGEFQQNFEYIEIPLNVRYHLIDSKIDLSLLGGFSSNLLIGNDAYLKSDGERQRIGETQNMNKVNYSTTFGFGIGYNVSDKISLNLEPHLKYFLSSLNSHSEVSFKPYSFGVYTGLSYTF